MDKNFIKKIISDISCPQDADEIHWLVDKVEKINPKVILEIGLEKGGSFKIWEAMAGEGSLMIGVDAQIKNVISFGPHAHLVEGFSQERSTIDRVKEILNGRQVDFLFIDGGHDLPTVTSDYNNYSPMVRSGGMIGFHDINDGAGVRQFWHNVPGNKEDITYQIGIGLIRKD